MVVECFTITVVKYFWFWKLYMWIRCGNDKSVWNKILRQTKGKNKNKNKKEKKQKQKAFLPKTTYFILSEITRVYDCILKCKNPRCAIYA